MLVFLIISCWWLSRAFLSQSLGPLCEKEEEKRLIKTQNNFLFSLRKLLFDNFKVQKLSFREITVPFWVLSSSLFFKSCSRLQPLLELLTPGNCWVPIPRSLNFPSWGRLARALNYKLLCLSNGHFLLRATT